MKIILRILTILLIGALVSGGIYFIVQNATTGSDMGSAPSFDQLPATATENLPQPPARPDGDLDHNSASLTRGLSEVLISLSKLTGITVIVLLVQSVLARLSRWRKIKPLVG
jgi:hypothetical protein